MHIFVCKAKSISFQFCYQCFSFFIFQAKSAATDDDSPGIENSAILYFFSLPPPLPFPNCVQKSVQKVRPVQKLKLDRSAE